MESEMSDDLKQSRSLAENEYLFRALKKEIKEYEDKNQKLYDSYKQNPLENNANICSLLDVEFQEIIQNKKDALEKHNQLLIYLREQKVNVSENYIKRTIQKQEILIKKNIHSLKREIQYLITKYNQC